MRREDKIQLGIILSFSIAALLSVLFILPPEISLSFNTAELKSSYYLILLTLLPLISTYLVAIKNLPSEVSFTFSALIEGYSILVLLYNLGVSIKLNGIILLLLSSAFLLVAVKIKDERSKVKIRLKWVTDEKKQRELQMFGFFIFLSLFIEGMLFALLYFIFEISLGYPIVSWMVTIAIPVFIMLKRSL